MGSFPTIFAPSPFGDAQTVFNPSRYYAETAGDDRTLPSSAAAHADTGTYLRSYLAPMVVIAVVIWALHKHSFGVSGSLSGKAGARA